MEAKSASKTGTITAEEAYEIGVEAYIYLYPLVLMDVTRRVMTNVPPGLKDAAGAMGVLANSRTFPPADFHDVVRPNFDTLVDRPGISTL